MHKKSKKPAKPPVTQSRATRHLPSAIVEMLRGRGKNRDEGAADTLAGGGYSKVREVLPTGLDVIDRHVLSIGGLPYGRITEISGNEDCGKSSFVNHLLAAAQADGAIATLGDGERKVHQAWVETFKVKSGDVVLLPAHTIESYLDAILSMIHKYPNQKFVHCLDSVATTMPKKAFEKAIEEDDIPGAMAEAWSRGLRHLVKPLSQSLSLMFLVNQLRSKIGVMYGPTENTAGGRAIPYYSTIRLAMSHREVVKAGDLHVGGWKNIRAFKNHLARQQLKADIFLDFGNGWNNDRSILRFAKEVGAVDKKSRSVKEARKNLDWGFREDLEDVVFDEVEKK